MNAPAHVMLGRDPAVDEIRTGYRRSVCGVDSIYYRVMDDVVDTMRVLDRQDVEGVAPATSEGFSEL